MNSMNHAWRLTKVARRKSWARLEQPRASDPRRSDRRYWLVLGESDAEGRLVIDQLRDEATYTVAVLADGFGTQGIAQLTAGQSDQTIRLRSPVIVSGKIVGDLSQLRKKYKSESEFILQYENPLEGDSDNHADLLSTTVKADGSFSISDVVPGCVEFRLPNMSGRQKVSVSQSIDDLVNFVVARICDQLGVEQDLTKRWGGQSL